MVEKASCPSHDPPALVSAPLPPSSPLSLPPALRCSRSSLAGSQPAREGAQEAQKAPFGLQDRFLSPKNGFGPKMHFGAKKRKTSPKRRENGKRMPKTPKKPLATVRFAEGCRNDPKMRSKTQKSAFLRPKPLLAQKSFLSKKCETERKSAKRVKMGSKTPRKALATVRLARRGRNRRFRRQKPLIFVKFRTFAPKTRFRRTFPFLV